MRSETLFERAKKVIPGGVNSPVRAFKAVGGKPFFVEKGEGAYIYSVDGKRYLDLVCSWGPLILGHCYPYVVEKVKEAVKKGSSFGTPTELEVLLAEKITSIFPSIDKVRLVNSGTEATMSAIRLARGFTERDIIVKFEGCYHGHSDGLLVKAGSGGLTFGIPTSPGVPKGFAELTYTLPYNDTEILNRLFEEKGKEIAAVIVEPVAGNMGVVPPEPGFLEALRRLTKEHGSLLIFDEVITGFRLTLSGYQGLKDIRPDITCLGKILGGGFPIGAFGGRSEIMDMLSPEGPIYQAGTLSGNPVAVAAGLATIEVLEKEDVHSHINSMTENLVTEMERVIKDMPVTINRVGSMFTVFFTEEKVKNLSQAQGSNLEAFSKFHSGMLENGVYLPPSQFETCFVSYPFGREELELFMEAFYKTVYRMF